MSKINTKIWVYDQDIWDGHEHLTSKPRLNRFETVPYYGVDLTHQIYAANTASFDSTEEFNEQSPVIIRGDHKPFKGTIQKRVDKPGYYSYECIDSSKKLFGNMYGSFTNAFPSEIVKYYLARQGFVTSGIEKSKKTYPKLTWSNTKLYDIIQQCAVLDDKKFYFNQDGIPIYETPDSAVMGYIFIPEQSITDYELTYDNSDIITDVKVFGVDNTYLAQSTDSKLVLKYGDIIEYITDSNITTKEKAQEKAKKEFAEKAKVQFSGTMTIPQILDIGEGDWCAMAPPYWQKGKKATIYYIQSVKTSINDTTIEQSLDLLNGRPAPPDNFVYVDKDGNKITCTANTTANNSNIVTGTFRPSSGWCKKPYKWVTTSFVNACQMKVHGSICGGKLYNAKKKAAVNEKEWTCEKCGADYDGVCGYEKSSPPRAKLIPASGVGGTTTTQCTTSASGTLGNLNLSLFRSPRDIRMWMDANIKYSFYYNYKYNDQQVLKYKKGNCYDQSRLFRDLVNAYFPGQYTMQAHIFNVVRCGSYSGGHQNTYIWINGIRYTADTTCSGQNTL